VGLPLAFTTAKHDNNNNNNNNKCSTNCNYRIAATLHTLEIRFISGVYNCKYPA
jgi:hypothetical protein